MGFADLHIHSIYSHDGCCTIPAILQHTASATRLNVIAITDHDKMGGIQQALDLAPRYGLEVVPGCEISTAQGHLLALFINSPVPAGLSLSESVRRVAAQGGLCVVPHPEAPGISGLRAAVIRAALAEPEIARTLVGIETFNGTLVYNRTNAVAHTLGQTLGMAQLGSSDSHILSTIGQGSTEFPGKTAEDLRQALLTRETVAHVGIGLSGALVLGHWFPRFMLRKMGWVAWHDQPEQPLRYVRVARTWPVDAVR